jgi:hypothetical protein
MKTLLGFLLVVMATFAVALPFAGPGVNTHGQLLPIDKLKAIGVRWVRGDVPAEQNTQETVRAFVRHYRAVGMPILWILPQTATDPAAMASDFYHWGVTDVEVSNEPEQGIFNPLQKIWTGTQYGRWFAGISNAIGRKLRLYGPAVGSWDPVFIRDAIRSGMDAQGVTFHGYWRSPEQIEATMYECKGRFGLPAICTEVGFPANLGPTAYPFGGNSVASFLSMRKVMGSLPWVYYDGPNANEDKSVGLFEWTGSDWSKTTATYDAILKAIRADARGTTSVRPRNQNLKSFSL